MVIEGLKFQFLVFRALVRAQDTIFAEDRLISESRFINQMCSFSVQNDKICFEQSSVFDI